MVAKLFVRNKKWVKKKTYRKKNHQQAMSNCQMEMLHQHNLLVKEESAAVYEQFARKMTEKNKAIRLAAAKKTIAKLVRESIQKLYLTTYY